ncbi:MAG: response regulator transcription factor [Thermoguttaceae bacterium]|nr:response regulator transcription factor [Thermoguttaceae bacterium]MDW8037360.1 response regulator transcription factor [Thermoguttaceae bacterium]
MTRKKHILVVEDEVHLATGIKYNLDAEGYQVTCVGDGRTALQLLEDPSQKFDLVILDLMLPGMSGYAVCEALRARQNDIPVLILSARTLPEDRIRGFDVGADQYLTKPFDLDEFLTRVRTLLNLYALRTEKRSESPPEPPSCVYRFGEAVVNFATFEVRVRNQSVRLTHLEMKLLRYFIENAGRVISRKELLERVWELPGYLFTRAPDQFIRRLRKIFEPNPAQPRYFLTIRDAGYRFVPTGQFLSEEASSQPDPAAS